jgi:hypothetical protein
MGLEELPQDSLPILVSGIKLYKDSGMLRLSIIFENDINYKQFKSLALKAGISLTVRYIDTSYITNAVDVAIDWVKDAKDPEL